MTNLQLQVQGGGLSGGRRLPEGRNGCNREMADDMCEGGLFGLLNRKLPVWGLGRVPLDGSSPGASVRGVE